MMPHNDPSNETAILNHRANRHNAYVPSNGGPAEEHPPPVTASAMLIDGADDSDRKYDTHDFSESKEHLLSYLASQAKRPSPPSHGGDGLTLEMGDGDGFSSTMSSTTRRLSSSDGRTSHPPPTVSSLVSVAMPNTTTPSEEDADDMYIGLACSTGRLPTTSGPSEGTLPVQLKSGDVHHPLEPPDSADEEDDDGEDQSSSGDEGGNAAFSGTGHTSSDTKSGVRKTQRIRKRQRKGSKGPTYVPSYMVEGTPCVVCGDLATGYHYKAMTCEGCKGFFRRSHHRDLVKTYKCRKGGTCIINITTRHECQFCRYQKCISMKMRPELVMSPMEREEKRRLVAKNREKKRQQTQVGPSGGAAPTQISVSNSGNGLANATGQPFASSATASSSVPHIASGMAELAVTTGRSKENFYPCPSSLQSQQTHLGMKQEALPPPLSISTRFKNSDLPCIAAPEPMIMLGLGRPAPTLPHIPMGNVATMAPLPKCPPASSLHHGVTDSALRKLMSGDVSVFDQLNSPLMNLSGATGPSSFATATGSAEPLSLKVQQQKLLHGRICLPSKSDEELVKQIYTSFLMRDEPLGPELESEEEFVLLTEKITNFQMIAMIIKNDSVELAKIENVQALMPDSYRQLNDYLYPMVVRNVRFLRRISLLNQFSKEDQSTLLTASFLETMYLHMLTNYEPSTGVLRMSNGLCITKSMIEERDCLRDLQLIYTAAEKLNRACLDQACFALMLCQLALESDRLAVEDYELLRRQQSRSLGAFQSYVCSVAGGAFGSGDSYLCLQRWTDLLMVLSEIRFLAAKYATRCLTAEMEKVVSRISKKALSWGPSGASNVGTPHSAASTTSSSTSGIGPNLATYCLEDSPPSGGAFPTLVTFGSATPGVTDLVEKMRGGGGNSAGGMKKNLMEPPLGGMPRTNSHSSTLSRDLLLDDLEEMMTEHHHQQQLSEDSSASTRFLHEHFLGPTSVVADTLTTATSSMTTNYDEKMDRFFASASTSMGGQ